MKIHLGRDPTGAVPAVVCVRVCVWLRGAEGGVSFDLEGAAGTELQPQGCCSLGPASVFLREPSCLVE